MASIQGITKLNLEKVIAEFERLSNTFYWKPPINASSRRNEEKRNSNVWNFTVDNVHVEARINVSCSAKNYYCHRYVIVGNEKKKMMIPYLKKLYETGTFERA